MNLEELTKSVNYDLGKGLISAYNLVSKFPYVTDNVTRRSFYLDPYHFPVFYHLGKKLSPKNVSSLSLQGGISLSCFLLSCGSVENVLAFQRKANDFYSPRMAKHNIRRVYKGRLKTYVGGLFEEEFQKNFFSSSWDIVFLDQELTYDEYLKYFRLAWSGIPDHGLLIIDKINYFKSANKAVQDFCKTCNRDFGVIDSKYGLGLVRK